MFSITTAVESYVIFHIISVIFQNEQAEQSTTSPFFVRLKAVWFTGADLFCQARVALLQPFPTPHGI